MTTTIRIGQAKGGQGASTFAAALAWTLSQTAKVFLVGHDIDTLAAIIGCYPNGGIGARVTDNLVLVPGVILGTAHDPEFVIEDTGSLDCDYLVVRNCYLALRRALKASGLKGVVYVEEPGRPLGKEEVEDVLALPIMTTVPVRSDTSRAIDAGLLTCRMPEPIKQGVEVFIASLPRSVTA